MSDGIVTHLSCSLSQYLFVGMFLNEEEKENKRRGDRDRTLDMCVEEKNKKKK